MLNVHLVKSFRAAKELLSQEKKEWVAIETEYGKYTIDETFPGVVKACNHHGDLQFNTAPAVQCMQCKQSYDNFLISHIDLDVLFGILWAAGWLKKTRVTTTLSELVALADIHGFHTIHQKLKEYPEEILNRYYAIGYLVNSWVFKDDGLEHKDMSKEVHKLLLRIKDIIIQGATPEQIQLYQEWFKEQQKVVKQHLQEIVKLCDDTCLFIFKAPFRLTTAYQIEDLKASIIIQYNEQAKSITLSCFDNDIAKRYFGKEGVIEPLQRFFGESAGGKTAIGGSPREANIQPEMLNAFKEFILREYINLPELISVE